jgi:hypothetical protein
VELEQELDRLYGVPLDDFTAERDKIARALKADGRGDEGDEVKRLRKPPVPVWVVNQLARRNRRDVDLLLDASHRLRESQRGLLAGEDAETFSQARQTQRKALQSLRRAAEEVLAGERGTAPEATVDRVVRALELGAVSDETREQIARGRLVEEPEMSGFDALAAMAAGLLPGGPKAAKPSPKPKPKAKAPPSRPDRRAIAEARTELKRAQQDERQAERQVKQARSRVDEARTRLERAERELAEREEEAGEATASREAAESRLSDAEKGGAS